MRAIDTNVLVRFLRAEGDDQAQKARAAIVAGDVFIATTVLLETEWVLRGAYSLERVEIVEAFRGLAGLPGVVVEDPPLLARALDLATEGVDLADALHLSRAEGCTAFLSFDRRLRLKAAGRSPIPVEEP